MPNPDASLFGVVTRHPLLSWMRPKPKDDVPCGAGGRADTICGLGVDLKHSSSSKDEKISSTSKSSSPPQLTAEEPGLSTAPVSTCASTMSGASWSDVAVGSNESSAGVIAFHRLEHNTDGTSRRPPLTLTVDPDPPVRRVTPVLPAPPVDIPWRVFDPDSAITPMQEALSNSLAQMELRMSGRHSTKIPKIASMKTDNHPYRRSQSAHPVSRAVDEAVGTMARGLLTGGERRERDLRKVASPPMCKLSPPPEAASFDGPSPYNGGAGGRGRREFEGYFPADSTADACPAASASSHTDESPVPGPGDDGVESDAADSEYMIFEFDDL